MTDIIGYIIPKVFKGNALTVFCKASTGHEFVAHTNLSLPDYLAIHEGTHVVSPEEFSVLYEAYLASCITDPVTVSEDRYQYMFEVLTPCRWTTFEGVEMFHFADRYTANIVSWFARYQNTFFEFMDTDTKTGLEIAEKVKAAYNQLQTIGA